MPRSAYAASVVESADVLRNVPLAIFVENLGAFSGSRREVADSSREFAENVLLGFSLEIVGIGAAIENMWIAAIELGLSGVFMGDVLIAEDFIRGALNLSGDLVGVLALGRSTSLVRSPKPTMDGRVVYL
jgi:nitroreductase